MRHFRHAAWLLASTVALLGCGDGGDSTDPPGDATRYTLRVENVAGAVYPTPISPGVWTAHADPDPFFTVGEPDRGEGLEALAEDGDPSTLAGSLDADLGGTFEMPASAMSAGPVPPGDFYETEVFVTGEAPRLSFATMVVESNDVFLATAGEGIALAEITEETDVTDRLQLYNAGTEADQAPGLGPMQAHRQEEAGAGSSEGVIRRFEDGTRTLPLAIDLVAVSVSESEGTYTLTFTNVGEERGLFVTPISPVFFAVHGDSFALYTEGEAPPDNGLEELAELADPRELFNANRSESGVLEVGVAGEKVESGEPGLARSGEAFAVEVTPDAMHPRLSVASMLVSTNDAFLGFDGAGVRLLDEEGAPRSAEAVERDVRRSLAVWDAGTETNEVPGAGWHQGPGEEAGLDDGATDETNVVRRYDDATNDVAGPMAGGLVDVEITHVEGTTFEVFVANRAGEEVPYRALLTPFVWIIHDETPGLYSLEEPPSPGMIELGEDCLTNALFTEMQMADGVLTTAVAHQPDDSTMSAPIRPGESFTFTVEAGPDHRFFNMASMPYPSNDLFVAFEPPGVALLDESGSPRSDAAIGEDVRAAFGAWDTGTEVNQAGGAGSDQVPLQGGETNVGPSEGDGAVRAEADPAYGYPAVSDLVRVTITPVEE
ncbi:MAG TPA: spondin domain-containing protein [Sandaracinaceae bacterium LLY-WYZ-13_1]|nr:spondin domain-containing protein [Sandaracinaceae bacterium LLY-WYZ-13_1]